MELPVSGETSISSTENEVSADDKVTLDASHVDKDEVLCGENDGVLTSPPITCKSPSTPGKVSPSKQKSRSKACSESCGIDKSKMLEKMHQIETEKLTLKQKFETSENHQDTLRSTLISKDEIIGSQAQIIKNSDMKVQELQKTVSKLELTIKTHNEVGMSCLELIVGCEEPENGQESQVDPVFNLSSKGKELYNENNLLRRDVKELQEKVLIMEEKNTALHAEHEAAVKKNDLISTKLSEITEKLKESEKTAAALRNKMTKNENVILDKEREIKVLNESAQKTKEEHKGMEEEKKRLVSLVKSVQDANKVLVDENDSLKLKILPGGTEDQYGSVITNLKADIQM